MLGRVKAIVDQTKKFLTYIVTPVVFIVGVIYYLVTKNSQLEQQLDISKGEQKLEDLKTEQEKADSHASDAISAWDRFYGRSTNVQTTSSSGDSGSESSDSNSGSGTGPSPGSSSIPDQGN